MRPNRFWQCVALTMLFAMVQGRARADSICSLDPNNLVSNCGFQTGDLTDWTANESADFPWAVESSSGTDNGYGPNSGMYFAYTGCVGPQCIGSDALSTTADLYQDLTTIAGDAYTISFFFASGGEPGEELVATFGETTLVDLVNLPLQDSSETGYTTTVVATGTDTRLEFQGRQDLGFNALDDISVDPSYAGDTPEPSSLGMFGCGLLALGLMRRFSANR